MGTNNSAALASLNLTTLALPSVLPPELAVLAELDDAGRRYAEVSRSPATLDA
jgi:hypothetical protein